MKHVFTFLLLSALLTTNSLFAQLSQSYTLKKKGLDYVQASQRLTKRFYQPGVDQPAPFVISGIPAGAVIKKAFLWASTSGNGVAISATIKNPANNTTSVPMTLIGSGPDKCWDYKGSYSYRADVTSLITGNGTYTISGLPTNTIEYEGDDPQENPYNDTDGATLYVIYNVNYGIIRLINSYLKGI